METGDTFWLHDLPVSDKKYSAGQNRVNTEKCTFEIAESLQ